MAFDEPYCSQLAPGTIPVRGCRDGPHIQAAFFEPHRTLLAAATAPDGVYNEPHPATTRTCIYCVYNSTRDQVLVRSLGLEESLRAWHHRMVIEQRNLK